MYHAEREEMARLAGHLADDLARHLELLAQALTETARLHAAARSLTNMLLAGPATHDPADDE